MQDRKLIVCLTGMPGAGKSTVASVLEDNGFLRLSMGDIIREEAKRKNLEPTDQNMGKIMLKMRQEMGQAAIAKSMLYKLKSIRSCEYIVIDGIRSIAEVEILREAGIVKVIAIHASSNKRYFFITKREREDAPTDFNTFQTRDKREMSVGISDAIALADESISNNNITKEELQKIALSIVNRWKDELK